MTSLNLSFLNVTVCVSQIARNWLYHDSQSRYQAASKFKDIGVAKVSDWDMKKLGDKKLGDKNWDIKKLGYQKIGTSKNWEIKSIRLGAG